ncbi:MAG: ABC transporter permease [Candidatus Nanopelagicales bacterium]
MTGPLLYEWRRIRTVRSTWLLVAVGIVVPAGLAVLFSGLGQSTSDQTGEPPAEVATALAALLPLAAAILCTVGAASFGQEYRHGLIRVTLSIFPQRTTVFAAKLITVTVLVAVTAVATIAAIVLAEYLGRLVAGAPSGWPSGVLGSLGVIGVLYVTIFALIAFAITALTRNQPLGIIAPIVLAVLIEPLIGLIAQSQFWTWSDWVLPFSSGQSALAVGGAEAWGHIAVFFAWFVALGIAAWLLFRRRDA